MSDKIQVSCEIEVTLKVMEGKWKLLILQYLMREGPKRYGEILRFLRTAYKRTLTDQLRELEADGVIQRKITPAVPVQVEYSMTSLGQTLCPFLEAMCHWGAQNAGDKYELTHPQCLPASKPSPCLETKAGAAADTVNAAGEI